MNFFRRDALELRFERREGILVPQTEALWALHADVFLSARGRKPELTITDAHLYWEAGREVIASCGWVRAVVDGRFRYPVEPLAFAVDGEGRELTLTFDKDLIRRPDRQAPAESRIVLRVTVGSSGREIVRKLWRVEIDAWDRPARLEWLGGGQARPETRKSRLPS